MELVDALSSNTTAQSVVELSLNPVHRRNYCSITRVLDEMPPPSAPERKQQNQDLTKVLSSCCPTLKKRKYHLFGVDCTSGARVHSKTLSDRSFVYTPNTILGNKPITIGHQYSIAAYLPEKLSENSPAWIIPLACERVRTDQKGTMIGMRQIDECIKANKSFKNNLCISVGDCAYSNPSSLFEAGRNPNQIHISRARNIRTLYRQAVKHKKPQGKGRPKKYGKKFKLKDRRTWGNPAEEFEFNFSSKKGNPRTVRIECRNNIFMRGKKKCDMSKCPFRLIKIAVFKSSGKLLFQRPMWLIISGEKRNELSLTEIYNVYRQRFDLEHFFRFGKNKLLLNKSQTPETDHEESWWQLVMIAYAQLYLGRDLASNMPKPWEKYLPEFKSSDREVSPTQVQKNFGRIIREIGTPAKPPKPRKKSKGRQQGDKQIKRKRYAVVMKKHKAAEATAVTT